MKCFLVMAGRQATFLGSPVGSYSGECVRPVAQVLREGNVARPIFWSIPSLRYVPAWPALLGDGMAQGVLVRRIVRRWCMRARVECHDRSLSIAVMMRQTYDIVKLRRRTPCVTSWPCCDRFRGCFETFLCARFSLLGRFYRQRPVPPFNPTRPINRVRLLILPKTSPCLFLSSGLYC